MSLEDLTDDVTQTYEALQSDPTVTLDTETRNELALLQVALGPESVDDLVRRAVHLLFQTTVETGRLDFHLRTGYDVTYDEYLSGMTYEQMTNNGYPQIEDERRYQF